GAKASLISTKSMSSMDIALRSRIFAVAGIGPSSIFTGSQPTVVCAPPRARGFRPSCSAFSRDMSSTAAAPSEICDELPAVMRPASLNTGLRDAQASRDVAGGDALVGDVGVAVDLEGHDLALELALLGRLGGELVRAQRELVELGARDLPLVGDHLGAQALPDDVVLLHELGGEGAAELLLGLHARGERQVAHVLDARPDDDVVDAGGRACRAP